jgi:MoaA/NifB/PqqE/SkfB family radical SAM enzyme
MLEYLKSRHVFMEFFDTFDLVDDRIADALVNIGVDKIWVSMDAATPETYEKIRVGAVFERSKANIHRLLDARDRRGSPLPEVWFHYIINRQNVAEMPRYIDLVHELTAGRKNAYATLVYFTSLLHFPEVTDLIPTIPAEIKQAVYEKADRYGIFVNWNENVSANKPIEDCTKWVEPFVLVTGHVQPCCAINMANARSYQKEHSWGNLLTEEFRDVWNSAKVAAFKKDIHAGRRPAVCKYCRIYQAGQK